MGGLDTAGELNVEGDASHVLAIAEGEREGGQLCGGAVEVGEGEGAHLGGQRMPGYGVVDGDLKLGVAAVIAKAIVLEA